MSFHVNLGEGTHEVARPRVLDGRLHSLPVRNQAAKAPGSWEFVHYLFVRVQSTSP